MRALYTTALALIASAPALAGTELKPARDLVAVPVPIELGVPAGTVGVGRFDATRPARAIDLAAGRAVRVYGDTYDSEPIILNTAQSVFSFSSNATGGQSLPYDGLFHPAGVFTINGGAIENGAALFDNNDGTYYVSVQTRISPLTDGFLPLGVTLSGSPATVIGWAVGNIAPILNRAGAPDSLDPAFATEFPVTGEFDVVDANVYILDNGFIIGSGPLTGLPYLGETILDSYVTVTGADGANIDQLIVEYLVQSASAPTELSLAPVDDCLSASENQLVVEINASGLHANDVGGQYFLQYDTSKLVFVSADPGDAPFTREIYEVVNAGAGTIDYATGVPNGDPGTAIPTTMARLTFNVLGDFCAEENLVTFRTHTPPSRITDANGVDLGAALVDLGGVTKDSVPPVIAAPADIAVNADAGTCDATLNFVEPFDTNPSLCPTQMPGCWYVDRYAPAGFESEYFDGDNRLHHSISSADSAANRPPAYSSGFYDTQGRKYDVDIPVGEKWSIDLYIPSSWATSARRADIWATTFDSFNDVSGFPILGFICNDPSDPYNTTPANPQPRFRFYTQDTDQDTGNGYSAGWIELGLPGGFSYDRWWTLEVKLTSAGYNYSVIDDTNTPVISGTDVVTEGSVRAGNVIVQAFNFGESYDIYWDNAVLGPMGAVATDDCSDVTVTYERSDNASLTLHDPFPQGTTTVTWTAADACGNTSSDTQSVTVNAFNTLAATVQLQGADAGPFDRCITFEFTPTGGGSPVVVNETMTFTGGLASQNIDVPCGDYDCITARDTLHTLRKTDSDDFMILGANYSADFTTAGGGDELLGGNLNDDAFIDILDFGLFIGQFGTFPGADTPCGTAGPHADISGDGDVDTADYSFIQINFFDFHELRCDGSLFTTGRAHTEHLGAHAIDAAPGGGPVLAISVADLYAMGMPEAAEGDLNHDGMLDTDDMDAFMHGARPDRLADLDGDGVVGARDLRIVVESFIASDGVGDVDLDGDIDLDDLRFVADRIGVKLHD